MKFIEAGLFGDVQENNGRAVHKTAGGDGSRERIFDRSVDAASGHAGRRRILRLCRSWRLSLNHQVDDSER
jgi:hypothetical protein